MRSPQRVALGRRLLDHDVCFKFRPVHLILAFIGDSKFQRRYAIAFMDDGRAGEDHTSRGPRKFGENNACADGDSHQARKRLKCDEQVSIGRPGRERAVADGREGLDAERKRFDEGARRGPLDAVAAEQIEAGKEDVDDDEAGESKHQQRKPGDGEQEMVGV